jgi:hypothetical protein
LGAEITAEPPVRAERPASEEPYWERYRPDPEKVLGWGTIRAGLAVLAFGIILTVLAIAAWVILIKNEPASLRSSEGFPSRYFLFRILDGFSLVGGIAVSATAMFMAIAVPSGFSAKGWAAGVVACLVLAGMTLLLLMFADLKNAEAEHKAREERFRARMDDLRRPVQPRPEPEPPWSPGAIRAVQIIYKSALILAGTCFGWFLWAVARRLGRYGLASATLVYVIVCTVLGIAVFILSIVAEKSASVEKYFTGGWVWGWLGVIGAFGLWTLVEVCLVRGAISSTLVRRDG